MYGGKGVYLNKYHSMANYYCGIGFRAATEDDTETDETNSSLYPNPVKSGEVLTVTLPDNENSFVSIEDILGKNVKSVSNVAGKKLEIPTEALSSGVYILQIKSKNKTTKLRFQVQ
jgi:hypothetical protein